MSNLVGTPKFTSIVLTWSSPQEPNGVIISYEVTYTVNGNNTVRVNTSDLSTTFTIPSLTPQTRVSAITVIAYTRIGQGEPANLPDQTTFATSCTYVIPYCQFTQCFTSFLSHDDELIPQSKCPGMRLSLLFICTSQSIT